MKMINHLQKYILPFLLLGIVSPAFAMSEEQGKEFNRIKNLDIKQLTEEASALLSKKYPDENWEAYDFPQFVFSSDSIEVGYMIAVKKPEFLSKIHCYCFCDAMGHENLLHCFFKKGKVGGEYEDHAVGCNICYGQAMRAFLWQETGVSDEEIIKAMDEMLGGMKRGFEPGPKVHEH